MRKLKSVKIAPTRISNISQEEMIFFGITAVCNKSILNYVTLLNTSEDFVIDGKVREMLEKVGEYLNIIISKCPKKSWNDLEILQVKSKTADYFSYLEALTGIRNTEDILKAKLYVQDYELLTSLVTSR